MNSVNTGVDVNKNIWNDNWREIAEYSAKSAGNLWAFHLIHKVIDGITLSEGGCVLDVGCGMGNKSAELAKIFPHNKVYGIDFAEEGIEFAKSYYSRISNLEFRCGDARGLHINDSESVEMITAFELIEHIEEWKSLLSDFCAFTNRYILLSSPTGRMREYEENIGHYRNFKRGEIEEYLSEKGFKTVNVLYAGFPFWSPITRDLTNLRSKYNHKKNKEDNEIVMTYNPVVHKIVYFLYRYLSFDSLGDQFIGLFEKI